jgi:ornithine--oxo-acid transaminase
MGSLSLSTTATQPLVPKIIAKSELTTEDYVRLDRQYAAPALKSSPLVISRGQGAYVWDINRNRYLDFLSMFSVVNQGYSHPRIVSAMIEQCQNITIVSRAFHNEHYPLLCQKLCQLLHQDQAFAMNSGSEATDLAIKLARKWAYRVKGIAVDEAVVVTVSGNYHGKTLGPLSASDNEDIRQEFGPFIPGVGPTVDGHTVHFNSVEDLEHVFRVSAHKMAAVMVECVQGYAGAITADDSYIRALERLCRKHNVLFIADEVQSGFGRAGYLMAYEKYNVQPDLVVIGKALTGGVYPMSMVLGRKEIMSQLRTGQHSSTYSGNPLASAVALAAVDVVLDEALPARSLRLGELMKARLCSIRSSHTTLEVTGQGLLCALHLDESHPSGRVTAARLAALMQQRGVLAYSVANRLRVAPPLIISEEELMGGLDVLEKSLHDLVHIEEI